MVTKKFRLRVKVGDKYVSRIKKIEVPDGCSLPVIQLALRKVAKEMADGQPYDPQTLRIEEIW